MEVRDIIPRVDDGMEWSECWSEWSESPPRNPRLMLKSQTLCMHFPNWTLVIMKLHEIVGPRPSFGENLVIFVPLLDFDMLVEEGAPSGAKNMDLTDFEGYVDLIKGPCDTLFSSSL
jgi:hypothetical protein